MKMSRSTGYGLLAACYMAKNRDQKIVLSQEISKRYDIPLEYLLKIMQQMVRANILRSKRGPRGGFSLAKPISKITMLQIIEAVDGPMENQLSLSELAKGEKFIPKVEQVCNKALAQTKVYYSKVSLSDLV